MTQPEDLAGGPACLSKEDMSAEPCKRGAHDRLAHADVGALMPCQAAEQRGVNCEAASSALRAHLVADAGSAAPVKARVQSILGPCGLAWRPLAALTLPSRERCAEPALSMNRVRLGGS